MTRTIVVFGILIVASALTLAGIHQGIGSGQSKQAYIMVNDRGGRIPSLFDGIEPSPEALRELRAGKRGRPKSPCLAPGGRRGGQASNGNALAEAIGGWFRIQPVLAQGYCCQEPGCHGHDVVVALTDCNPGCGAVYYYSCQDSQEQPNYNAGSHMDGTEECELLCTGICDQAQCTNNGN